MKYLKNLVTVSFAITIVLGACTKDEYALNKMNSNEQHGKKSSIAQPSEGLMSLGNQLEDPYALKNMKKAYSNLKAANPSLPDVNIQPTHLYMRFLPSTEEELSLLKSDTSLVLYDYPLNFEITTSGTYYHDPSIPETAITWQYCVIPIKHSIPNVPHELLYEVYIPDDDIVNTKGSPEVNQLLLDMETESVNLTGNMPKGILPSKWTPKGTILVWDDILTTTTYTQVFDHWEYYDCSQAAPLQQANATNPAKHIMQMAPVDPIDPTQCQRAVYRTVATTTQGRYIPLVGASVHARWFVHIETDLTDANGYFQTSRFRYEVNYAIKWERSHYDIRNGMFLQAWYNGPKQKGDWNLNIKGGKSIMFATMHRAACKHFYGDNLGLNRPTLNYGGKTKICYRDGVGTGVFWGDWSTSGILPDIQVWGKDQYGYRPTQEIFGTTAHELGHQAHSQNLGNIQYWQVSKIIYESWADAVEWALSNDEYHYWGNRFGIAVGINYNHPYNKHDIWPFVDDKAYSPIFIDLMDDNNQRTLSSRLPNDLIKGYTLSYVNWYILRNSYGISSLFNEVKNHKITGVTDTQINELFALYW
ncbi:MAG: hypothetical protein HOO91_18305 [Bacteroidales bacterium]|nr:hypothetical protein [Bacteroidales bacterium]